jgi:hypothetical protein
MVFKGRSIMRMFDAVRKYGFIGRLWKQGGLAAVLGGAVLAGGPSALLAAC